VRHLRRNERLLLTHAAPLSVHEGIRKAAAIVSISIQPKPAASPWPASRLRKSLLALNTIPEQVSLKMRCAVLL
jgi:hypothetical protein